MMHAELATAGGHVEAYMSPRGRARARATASRMTALCDIARAQCLHGLRVEHLP